MAGAVCACGDLIVPCPDARYCAQTRGLTPCRGWVHLTGSHHCGWPQMTGALASPAGE